MATRQAITQMASTNRERVLRFELQMAEQARKLGGRLAELREGREWAQKDVVSAMAELGDDTLNTNQLSRYENGKAFPGETRLERFATTFGVEACDLIAGPIALREAPTDDQPSNDEADRLGQVEEKLDDILRWIATQRPSSEDGVDTSPGSAARPTAEPHSKS